MLTITPLSKLDPYKGEWEHFAEIRGNTAVFDENSPAWQAFNELRKVWVAPSTAGFPTVDETRRELRHGNCCDPPRE